MVKFYKNTYTKEVLVVDKDTTIIETNEYILDGLVVVCNNNKYDINKYVIPKHKCVYGETDFRDKLVILPRVIPNDIFEFIKYINDTVYWDKGKMKKKTLEDFILETEINLSEEDIKDFTGNIDKYAINYRKLAHTRVVWFCKNGKHKRLVIEEVDGICDKWEEIR